MHVMGNGLVMEAHLGMEVSWPITSHWRYLYQLLVHKDTIWSWGYVGQSRGQGLLLSITSVHGDTLVNNLVTVVRWSVTCHEGHLLIIFHG